MEYFCPKAQKEKLHRLQVRLNKIGAIRNRDKGTRKIDEKAGVLWIERDKTGIRATKGRGTDFYRVVLWYPTYS